MLTRSCAWGSQCDDAISLQDLLDQRRGRSRRAHSSLIGYGESDFLFRLRRPIRKLAIGSRHSSGDLQNSAGRTAVTFASNIALAGATPRAGRSLQRSCWNCDLTRSSLRPCPPLPRCGSKLCQYQSFSCRSLTRFRLALSQISLAQKAISRALPISSFRLVESGCRSSSDTIIAMAAQHRLPAVYPYRFFALSGGLVSYGIDLPESYRRAASYVDRILRGAKPAGLPVELPIKFELVINLKTAKALGIAVPPTLLATADEVIE
jgi:hypothetical protein